MPSPASELPYDVFASVYDHFFGPAALPATLQALGPLLLDQLAPGSRILDLCCGTGELTHALTQHGFTVHGIDSSAEMLRLARARVPRAIFRQADMRNFASPERYQAVICAYNSLPHITSLQELVRVCANVGRVLYAGGVFMFDVYSEQAYAERWRGSFTRHDDNFSCRVTPSYNTRTRLGENHISITANHTLQAEVRLVTRCYSRAELQFALFSAGFCSVKAFDAGRDLHLAQASGRVFWKAANFDRQ
ncbi:MAG TPA: methyltransferase domain-containing protein [Terriglobales bacterium]|nr:methyltransferase domain-containing protein [Terriglobales bacterium]